MSRRNGVHGPRPRPHWPKSTILLHDAIILRVDMMNAARVGPEEALRGRDCCKGVGPTPTEEGEGSQRSRHGVQRAHGPECASKNRRIDGHTSPSHFGDAVRSVGRGRLGAPPLAERVT